MLNKNSTLEQIDEELKYGKGKVEIQLNQNIFFIDCGKYKTSYPARIATFFLNENILLQSDNIYQLYISLTHLEKHNLYINSLQKIINNLNDNDCQINFGIPISMPDKTKRHQIRIGSIPFYTFSEGFNSNKQLIEKMKSDINFVQPKYKSDSISWKPQTIFSSNITITLTNYETINFVSLGNYHDSFLTVSESISHTLINNSDLYTRNETTELNNFANNLNYTSTINQLEFSYLNLLKSSIRAHEIHKNFGELYAALYYSFQNKFEYIYIPVSAQTPLYDFISISQQSETSFIVKEIPIKGKEYSASTALTALLTGLIFKNNKEGKEMQFLLKYIPNSYSAVCKLKKNYDSKLKIILQKILNKINYDIFINEKDSNYILIKPLFKNIEVAKRFWQYLLPFIDINKTKKKIQLGCVSETGYVEFKDFDPRTVSITSPKRLTENVTAIMTNKKPKL